MLPFVRWLFIFCALFAPVWQPCAYREGVRVAWGMFHHPSFFTSCPAHLSRPIFGFKSHNKMCIFFIVFILFAWVYFDHHWPSRHPRTAAAFTKGNSWNNSSMHSCSTALKVLSLFARRRFWDWKKWQMGWGTEGLLKLINGIDLKCTILWAFWILDFWYSSWPFNSKFRNNSITWLNSNTDIAGG